MSMVDTAPGKIQVRDLNFYYGKFHALKNINLDIAKNQVTAFIGPSGCGKSTLLRMIAGLEEISAGELVIGVAIHLGGDAVDHCGDERTGVRAVVRTCALHGAYGVVGVLHVFLFVAKIVGNYLPN